MCFSAQHLFKIFCWKIVAVPALIILLWSCENSIKEINALTVKKNSAQLEGKNVEVLYSDSGVVRISLTTKEVKRFTNEKDPYMEYPQGIEVFFYNSNHEVEATLKAKYAIYKEKEQRWRATNDVVATSKKEGKKLNTEELIWDAGCEKFFSDKAVTICSDEEVIIGQGFEANSEFSNWKIKRIRNSYVNIKDN